MNDSIHRYTQTLRQAEFAALKPWLATLIQGKTVLEIGSGDGTQLALLRNLAGSVVGVDVPNGSMVQTPQPGVQYYDGVTLPFPAASVDVIYSSHTLEHVQNWSALSQDMQRVLRPDGLAIHVVPTAAWRVLSWLTHWPMQPRRIWRALAPRPAAAGAGTGIAASPRPLRTKLLDTLWPSRHSEFGNRFTEVGHLTQQAWHQRLTNSGWSVVKIEKLPYLYTDNFLLGPRLPLTWRAWLGRTLGLQTSLVLLIRPRRT